MMIAGYQHLHTLGMVAEQVARNCWLADGMSVGGNDTLAEQPMERALRACDEIAELVQAIRIKRSDETAIDAFAAVLDGKASRIAKPGQWVVYRDSGKVICEVQSDEA